MPRSSDKTKAQLVEELEVLRERVTELEVQQQEHVNGNDQMLFQAAILENMTDWVTATDLDDHIIYTTPSIRNVLGYTPEEVAGHKSAAIFWREIETQPGPEAIRSATVAQGSWRGETINRTKDGRRVVIGLQTNTILDDADRVIGIIGVARDVTEQRSTEEALRRSEERFRDMADLLPNTVCEVNLDLRLTYVNKVGLETFGYSEEEIRALPSVFALVHPDDRERAAQRTQQVLLGERLASEYRMVRKDNSEVKMLVSSSPMYDDGVLVGMRNSLTDVTQYNRALRELQVSEERHRMLIEAMNDGLGVQDENGVLIQVNQRLCSMLGYTPEEFLGRRTIEMMDEDAREVFLREVAKRKQRDRTPYEITFTRKDGHKVHSIMSPAPLFDADGNFRGSFAVVTDVTEIKRAEEALEKERHLLRTVMDSVPDSIYVKDRESRFLMTNAAHLAVLGLTSEGGVKGKTDLDFFPRELAEQFYREEQELIRGEKPLINKQGRNLYKSGGARWVESIKAPLRSPTGKVIGIVGVSRDITERKQAEEALRATEERLRTILDNSRDIAFKLNVRTGSFEYVSLCVEELLGFTPLEVLAMTVEEFEERVHPDDREDLRSHRYAQLRNAPESDAHHLIEYRLRHKDGEYRWFAESTTLMWDKDQLTSVVGTLRDVTPRKQAEEAVLQASRMEATATLAGGIAHDFNNLMVGVLGNAELLQMKLGDYPEAKRQLENIAKAAQKAGELAQKMLAFARGGQYQPQVLDLNLSILEVLTLEERSFPPNVRIHHDLEHDLWPVRADPAQISQVVMNLSINAVEAIGDQHGQITITTRNLDVDHDFARMHKGLKPGRYAYLAVEDTGQGMSSEVKNRVFEPFFTTKFQGRGLGLAAVYGIVNNHSGFISVYSEEGHGTSFKVYLPAVPDEWEEMPIVPEIAAPPRSGQGTILLIDDEDMVLSVTQEILEFHGYEVIVARDGRQGIHTAQTYPGYIDLCILDMGMPVMGGAEAYPSLRAARPDMKVIICSGYELGPAAQALLDAGATSFVQKPFRADVILNEVANALER